MHEVARELLARLLAAAERRDDDGAAVTLPLTPRRAPGYLAHNTLAEREAIQAVLANAQAAGAVRLEWGRFEEARDLKRLRLVDADRLAAFLGEERLEVRLARLREAAVPVLGQAPAWLQEDFDRATVRWGRGASARGLAVDDVGEVVTLYRALAAADRGEHRGLDLRTFSVRCLDDSKAMERLQSRIAAVLRAHLGLDGLNDAEVYAELGLEKYPQPVFVKGPLRLGYSGRRLDLDRVRPYLALSPDGVHAFETVTEPDYVLTVENLTSYQRHVREIDDRGIVLYSAGFPGLAFRAFLLRLDEALGPGIPFFHWGDVDVGGLRLFARIAATLVHHSVRPHLMGPPYGGDFHGRSFSSTDKRRIERVAGRTDPTGDLARQWLVSNTGPWEQEEQDPESPMGRPGSGTSFA
jgi:hypothetical protein